MNQLSQPPSYCSAARRATRLQLRLALPTPATPTFSTFRLPPAAFAILASLLTACLGCASWTNPIANGIPARLVPDELLADSKNDLEPIPLSWLRNRPESNYRLAPGDILGVFIEGVLGEPEQLPPINFPDLEESTPSVGFPIPIRENGTVPLPLVKPIKVEGMTLDEAQAEIIKAYTADTEILKLDEQGEIEARILVALALPRRAKILVIREDAAAQRTASTVFSTNQLLGRAAPLPLSRGQGTGDVLDIAATDADLLTVLARSGGLPGPTAANEVIIQRGYADSDFSTWPTGPNGNYLPPTVPIRSQSGATAPSTVRIPLRLRPGERPSFTPDDIQLSSGDIVYIPALDAQVYYTGGLLPSREVPLPRDYDLGAIEALLRVGGPFLNGALNSNVLSGGIINPGIGNPSPSLLTIIRHTPDGRQVAISVDLNRAARDARENLTILHGDVLVLQETPQEAFARYVTQVFNFNIFAQPWNRGSSTGTAIVNVP